MNLYDIYLLIANYLHERELYMNGTLVYHKCQI